MQSEAQAAGEPGQRIVVSVEEQTLELLDRDGNTAARYPISTSKFGLGSEEGSFRTPIGRFAIDEMIGDGAAERTIFRSREEEGVWDPETATGDEGDLVLTRILWLLSLIHI